jgi:glutathione S-transferase
VGSPPHFAPPCLELPSGKYLSQTSAILDYLAAKLGLDGSAGVVGEEEEEEEEEEEDKMLVRSHVNQLVLTALDLNNEVGCGVCSACEFRAYRTDRDG